MSNTFLNFAQKDHDAMSLDGSNCCCCAGKMREGRHDFMAGTGEAALMVRDVPALICDTCGEVEYTLETSREIDAIMKDFFAGRLLAKILSGRYYLSLSG